MLQKNAANHIKEIIKIPICLYTIGKDFDEAGLKNSSFDGLDWMQKLNNSTHLWKHSSNKYHFCYIWILTI